MKNKSTSSGRLAGASSPVQTAQRAAAVAVAASVPTILWGEPGTDKSSWTKAFAERPLVGRA